MTANKCSHELYCPYCEHYDPPPSSPAAATAREREIAWNIASRYSAVLASETRDLSEAIGSALAAAHVEGERAGMEKAAGIADQHAINCERHKAEADDRNIKITVISTYGIQQSVAEMLAAAIRSAQP